MNIFCKFFKACVYKDLHSISELKDKRIQTQEIPPDKISICVIDDQGFEIDALYSLGFRSIHKDYNFTDINSYKDYDVILCDIADIGNSIDPISQGIAVAETLKNQYPNKIVYLYTGNNPDDYGEHSPKINRVVRKPTTMKELAFIIKADVSENADPVKYWEKIRTDLLAKGTSSKTIAYIEDTYVLSLLKGVDFFNPNKSGKFDLSKLEISAEILSIISSGMQIVLAYSTMVK